MLLTKLAQIVLNLRSVLRRVRQEAFKESLFELVQLDAFKTLLNITHDILRCTIHVH